MTSLDGEHWHLIDTDSNQTSKERGEVHEHLVQLNTTDGVQEFNTSGGINHIHQLQVSGTVIDGLHTHMLQMGGQNFISLMPGDLIEGLESSLDYYPAFKDLKITPIDFSLVKKLNKTEFKALLEMACVKSLFKNLTRLADGMRIQSLVFSKDRFSDVGQATTFLSDHGLNTRDSETTDSAFTFLVLSESKFQEATLQRVRLTEGVEAVVGFLKPEPVVENDQTGATTDTIDSMQDHQSWSDLRSLELKLKNVEQCYTSVNKTRKPSMKEKVEKKVRVTMLFVQKNLQKRLVTGPVLIPEVTDLQDDIISAEEIETASHNYMIKLNFANDPEFLKQIGLNARSERGFMHVEFSRKIALVENYLAPVDFTMDSNIGEARKIIKGTWIATVKIFDDEVMSLVNSGKITGFSIGGRSKVIELEDGE